MEGPSTDFREVVSAPVPHAGPRRPGPFPFPQARNAVSPFCSDYVVLERLMSFQIALVPHPRPPFRAGTFPRLPRGETFMSLISNFKRGSHAIRKRANQIHRQA